MNRKSRKRTGFYEEDRSPSWFTTTFEWLALMTQYWITPIHSLTHKNNIQKFDTWWDEVLLFCHRFRPMMSGKVCTNWEYVSPRNSKLHWNCTIWRFIWRFWCPVIKNWRQWWRGVKIRNYDAKLWRQARQNWNRSSDQEPKGIKWRWRRKRYLLPVERKKASVRKETSAVSSMRVTIMHKNRHPKPPHFLSHPCHEFEVCRGKEVSQTRVTLAWFFDNRADTERKVLAR